MELLTRPHSSQPPGRPAAAPSFRMPHCVPGRGRHWFLPLVLLAILLASGCGLQRTRLHPGPPSPGDWPTLGGNPANQGVSTDQRAPLVIDTLIWRRKVSAMAAAEPMVRDGFLYYGSADGHLEIHDAHSGARLARTDFKGPVTGILFDDSGFVVSTDQNERRIVWMRYNPFERRRDIRIPSSSVRPCRLDDGSMIVAEINGTLTRYDTLGNTLWTIETKAPITASPIRADSLILIPSGRNMVARRISDGSQVWSHQASGAILAAAALDDRAYFGSTDSLLYAVNLKTGSMEWFFATHGQIVVSPVIGRDRIYAGSNDYHVYALNMAKGDTIWSYDTGGPVTARPTLAGDILYVGTQLGELLLLNADTGALLKSFKLTDAAATPPIVANGRVYIADNNRRLHCFGPVPANQQ